MTILLITHQMDVVAQLADEVAVLSEGHLVESGPVAEVFADPQHPLTQRFVETVIQREVPEHVRETIREGRFDRAVQLVHTGGAAQEVFTQLVGRFGVDARLLASSSTELAETTVGTTIVGLRGGEADGAVAWLSSLEGVTVNEVEA